MIRKKGSPQSTYSKANRNTTSTSAWFHGIHGHILRDGDPDGHILHFITIPGIGCGTILSSTTRSSMIHGIILPGITLHGIIHHGTTLPGITEAGLIMIPGTMVGIITDTFPEAGITSTTLPGHPDTIPPDKAGATGQALPAALPSDAVLHPEVL